MINLHVNRRPVRFALAKARRVFARSWACLS